MKLAFLGGGPSDALPHELRALGHEVLASPVLDWYRACLDHLDPGVYAERAWPEIRRFAPDVIVLNKGWHGWAGREGWWYVPLGLLAQCREICRRSVYICYDDPAATPITLSLGLPVGFDLWLTSCPGIGRNLFPSAWSRIRADVHEFWLAWDTRNQFPTGAALEAAITRHACDLAVTGSPYYKPFPPPHYQTGFAGPRRDLVFAAIAAGFKVGIYGPATWLKREHGGDPRLAPYYRGWVDPRQIHVVHHIAKTCLGTHLVEGRRYDSGRLPWVLGAGGCLLHELRPGLRDEFGSAVAWYTPGDVVAFVAVLKNLLADPAKRLRMITAGRRIVLDKHTWAHRARRFIALVEGYTATR